MNEIDAVTPNPSTPNEDAVSVSSPASIGIDVAKPMPENRFSDVVSGQFDADEELPELLPPKRVLSAMAETPKLHKVLAQAGMGSRLEMEQLILEGRISVNNEPAHIGQRIQFGDHIKVNGKPIRFRIEPPPPPVIAYHKPVGEVVTHDDPQNRRIIKTDGCMVELPNNVMHPRFGLEREYAVRVLGSLSKDEKQMLLNGVQLDDGIAQFGSIEDGGGEGANCWYRVTISEGRNREVRRMLEAAGHAVSRLIRIRYGAMVLPRGLKRGGCMELDESDIRALMQASGGPAERGAPAARDPSSRDGQRRRGRTGGPRGANNGSRNAPQGGFSGEGFKGSQGQGRQGSGRQDKVGGRSEASQPDPMKTAFGYIGADSFTRQRQERGQGQRPGGPPSGQRRGGRNR